MEQILVFKNQDIPRILETFKVKINKKGELVSSNNLVKCDCCGQKLKKENVGSILSSSPYKFYCDNPICISEYVRKTKFGD